MARQQSRLERPTPPRILGTTHGGKPAAMIFVNGKFGNLKLDRVVRASSRGYAAYRPGEAVPFLVAREFYDAIGWAP